MSVGSGGVMSVGSGGVAGRKKGCDWIPGGATVVLV